MVTNNNWGYNENTYLLIITHVFKSLTFWSKEKGHNLKKV